MGFGSGLSAGSLLWAHGALRNGVQRGYSLTMWHHSGLSMGSAGSVVGGDGGTRRQRRLCLCCKRNVRTVKTLGGGAGDA